MKTKKNPLCESKQRGQEKELTERIIKENEMKEKDIGQTVETTRGQG